MNLIEKILEQKPQYETIHIDLGDESVELPVRDDISIGELQGVIAELQGYCLEDGMFKRELFEASFPIVYFSVACPDLVMDGSDEKEINVLEMSTVFKRLDFPAALPSSAFQCYCESYDICLDSLKETSKQLFMKNIADLGDIIQMAKELFTDGKEAFMNMLDSDDFQDTVKSLLENNLNKQ